jgi:AraC-like DNA-binding protein
MAITNRQQYLREEYTARVNRVIDHIEANIDQELSLKELADIAGFSSFHFHRIFGALVGETLRFYTADSYRKSCFNAGAEPEANDNRHCP